MLSLTVGIVMIHISPQNGMSCIQLLYDLLSLEFRSSSESDESDNGFDNYLIWNGTRGGSSEDFSCYRDKSMNDILAKYKGLVLSGHQYEFL